VVAPLNRFAAATSSIAQIVRYGELDYSGIGQGRYELLAVAPKSLRPNAPIALVTGEKMVTVPSVPIFQEKRSEN
jgi:hypothetical protein